MKSILLSIWIVKDFFGEGHARVMSWKICELPLYLILLFFQLYLFLFFTLHFEKLRIKLNHVIHIWESIVVFLVSVGVWVSLLLYIILRIHITKLPNRIIGIRILIQTTFLKQLKHFVIKKVIYFLISHELQIMDFTTLFLKYYFGDLVGYFVVVLGDEVY